MTQTSSFSALGISPEILEAIEVLGFDTPSSIQEQAIPAAISGADIVGLSHTGSGKTLAFAIPALECIEPEERCVQVLALCPTRELAVQICREVDKLALFMDGVSAVPIYGGASFRPQLDALRRGVQFVVGTPGRVMDLMESGALRLDGLRMLILDEADHMLDMGFAPALKKIVSKIPRKRHTQMFSATMPDNIRQLAQTLLQKPETVRVSPPSSTADRVEQFLCMVGSQAEKRPLTLELLKQQELPGRTLIFTRTRHGADCLASFLSGKDYPASAIHGDKSQGRRERLLREFRSGKTPVLVATDIAARGIDVKDVQLVINYDLPEEPEVYVHRIGRTARAGAAGQAIALCSPEEIRKARDVHKLLGRLLPVHPSSASVPDELRAIPEARRKRSSSMQEKRSAPRRKPRKGYGRNGSRAEA